MDGKKLKEIVSRIPDDADIVKVCAKYIAWRVPGQHVSCYSFHPEHLDSDIC